MTDIVELAVVPKESALQVFSAANGLDPYLEQIREVLDAFEPDVSTKKGRDAIASIAHKVSRAKTALDGVGKDLVADLKDLPKKVDAERKRMRDTLDTWKDEVRAPLTAWETTEQARIDRHTDAIEKIRAAGVVTLDVDADSLRQCIAAIDGIDVGESWEEYEPEAVRTKERTLASLREALVKREKHDADQAELVRLRKINAERDEKDRLHRVADEAAAAERARAETAAANARDEAARQLAAANAATEKAERERVEAEQAAEKTRANAQAQADAAAAAERQRQADAAAEEERQRVARENDRAHRAKINGAALAALMAGGLTEDCAKTAITLIARGQVPAIRIDY